MSLLAFAALAAFSTAAPAAVPADAPGPAFPPGPIELEGRPLRVAVLERGGELDVLLLRDRQLERFRIRDRTLVRSGRYRSASSVSRPLFLDAARNPSGGDPIVVVVFGEDVQSVDRGIDTRLHAFVLSAGEDGAIRPASDDLGGWLRMADGAVHLQGRGAGDPVGGAVRRVEEKRGRYVAEGPEVLWAGRGLLEATPLPGAAEALAWDGGRPMVVKLAGGDRVPGGSILGDLGSVEEPRVAIRVDRPIFRGIDREGRIKDSWHPLPRRVSVAEDGAVYTVLRERSKSFFGKTSGQDAVVRLDWSGGALAVSRPYPGVDAFVLDFALIERPGMRPAALLLVNEKGDGSGQAHLVFQETREDRGR